MKIIKCINKKMEIAQGRYHKFSLLVIRYAKAARVNKLTSHNLATTSSRG